MAKCKLKTNWFLKNTKDMMVSFKSVTGNQILTTRTRTGEVCGCSKNQKSVVKYTHIRGGWNMILLYFYLGNIFTGLSRVFHTVVSSLSVLCSPPSSEQMETQLLGGETLHFHCSSTRCRYRPAHLLKTNSKTKEMHLPFKIRGIYFLFSLV